MGVTDVPVRLGRRLRRRLRGEASGRDATPRLACNAPSTSMYLDQHGFVRACCMNDYQLLGNVTERRLVDIWRGPEATELRRAMERHDLELGCEFCKWQVDEGRADLAFSRWFRDFEADEPDPDWPQQLELSISNTCNLQCAMCNGEWSSSIRSQREHRPPLPRVYTDEFFDDLREFIPHLRRVKFLGGEPFLAAETLRVMDLLVEHGDHVRCHVTTNGTQWTPRVERILDMLPVDVAVSLDAATKPTYESIRIGSTWEQVQDHLDRFCRRAELNGSSVTVTMCLMANNWHEFLDFCRNADERGIGCAVNTVTEPAELSLYKLPLDELAEVVDHLDRQDRESGASLGLSRATWTGEVDKLRRHLDDKRRARRVTGLDRRRLNPEFPRPFPSVDATSGSDVGAPAATAVAAPVRTGAVATEVDLPGGAHLVLDRHQRVVGCEDGDAVLDIPASAWIDRDLDDLAEVVTAHLGRIEGVEQVLAPAGYDVFDVLLADGRRARAVVVAPRRDGEGGRLHAGWRPAP